MIDEQLSALVGKSVVVAGKYSGSQVETNAEPDRIDHVWITVTAGEFGRVRISLNTCSLKNLNAGFDPRILVSIIPSRWTELPAPGIRESSLFDYAALEPTSSGFVAEDRRKMEQLLLDRARRTHFVEAWGELYDRGHVGLHQVHSRRASLVVKTEHVGRDGAIRFYFPEGIAETLLFKFSGQK